MRYTNKKILKITFPVLVCLLMEQLIGLTGMVQSFLVCSINEIYSFNA